MANLPSKTDFLLSDTVNELLLKLPRDEFQRMVREIDEACLREGITYVDQRDNQLRVIPLMPAPRIINPIQRSYFHYVCLQIVDALKKLCAVYISDPQVRKLLPLSEAEEQWVMEAWGEKVPRFHTVISRLDANTEFSALDWRENFQFFEANSVGIGGLHYCSLAEKIILEVVGPRLKRLEPELYLEPNDDMRDLLLDELRLHARSLGRQTCNIAFLDDPKNISGITEYPRLAEYFASRGHQAIVADPREIRVRDDELYYRDMLIDVIYRDMDIKQCIALENNEGIDLQPIRKAFQRNQMVSSLAGDFDHKSCWELFTDDFFCHHFTAAQWRIFNRHVLWTRLIRETKTSDETGRMIDLIPYVQKHRPYLVIKPNREYGGVGVTIGPDVTQAEWERVLQEAVSHPFTYVVQRYTQGRCKSFPMLQADGSVTPEDFYITCGFVVTAKDIGLVGRSSRKAVVNVAQQGGLTTVLMILDQQRF
jgi:uncharacterized circularly permuted ATP-grasp superfamily protein